MEWLDFIKQESQKPYMKQLRAFVDQERNNYQVYPKNEDIFNAFKLTPYSKVKCVILGQDPYPTPFTAHGFSFSSLQSSRPPSLQNIFKEIKADIFPKSGDINCFKSNNLIEWAEQGVLLLNTVFTVRSGAPGSHKGQGWEKFTAEVLKQLDNHPKRLVFMFWGKDAQAIGKKYILSPRHLVLEAAHPAAETYNEKNGKGPAGFFGCKHFSQANDFISQFNPRGARTAINWGIWKE